jgi:putative methionine-R-sulfoxide reductase with GAF domain
MRNPKQKNENKWVQRLMRFFRRDKTNIPKQKVENTEETRNKLAFSILLGTGVLMLTISISFAASTKSLSDERVLYAGIMVIACLIGAGLARMGKGAMGAGLGLISFYIVALLSALKLSGGGLTIGAVAMSLTLGFTSAVMQPALARRFNTLALLFISIPLLLDLFEPFPRIPDPTPGTGGVLMVIIIVIYAAIVVRQFNSYNLRTKLLIAFATLTIAPLITIGLYDSSQLSEALRKNVQNELGQFANQTASRVDTFVESQLTFIHAQSESSSFIQFLSLTPADRKGSLQEKDAQDTLTAFARQDKFINAYSLLDNNGEIVLDFVNNSNSGKAETTDFFKPLLTKKESAINGPFINQQSSKASLYFSSPIKNQTGSFLGILVVEYDADVIEALVEDLIPTGNSKQVSFGVVDKTTFIQIANTQNIGLLYKSYQSFTSEQIASLQRKSLLLPQTPLAVDKETVAGLQGLNQSASFTTIDDKTLQSKNLNSAVQLKNVPWLAFARQSESTVLIPVVQQRRTTVIIFIVLLALVTLASLGLSQLLASPILRLAFTAEKIAAGDLSLQSNIESNDEIGTLAKAFDEMTRQSRALIDSLEQRSKALATSSEVSRRISTILDQQELVTEVVKQVQSAFNYYHAHIYILDENTQELVMAGGTGEAGKAMLARGHKIAMGKGLVGRAAQNNITVLVTDVSQEPQWLPNPLLPETKSEVAVPIAIADRVLGVLDVQHNVAGALRQEDVDVLQSIANQVAFAVRNARSYSEVQAKADREALITSIGQKIQGTITVESALQVAIREIGRALNGAKTQIILNENSTADAIRQSDEPIVEPKI